MAEHLLRCSCGLRVPVTTSMAGESVRCSCGAQLDVPTLRELRQLPLAEPRAGSGGAREWNDQHRLTFVFLVAAIAAGGLAGFLAMRLPGVPRVMAMPVDEPISDSSPPEKVLDTWDQIRKQGIRVEPQLITLEARKAIERRQAMVWGIRVALAVGAFAMVAAAASLLVSPARQRRYHAH